jgi:ABC-type lipoprotein release transport system permease subunit
MFEKLKAFFGGSLAQTLSESALIYFLIVILGVIPLIALGASVLGFWEEFTELFDAFA